MIEKSFTTFIRSRMKHIFPILLSSEYVPLSLAWSRFQRKPSLKIFTSPFLHECKWFHKVLKPEQDLPKVCATFESADSTKTLLPSEVNNAVSLSDWLIRQWNHKTKDMYLSLCWQKGETLIADTFSTFLKRASRKMGKKGSHYRARRNLEGIWSK